MTAGRPRLNKSLIEEVERLVRLGWTQREIASKLNVGKGTVYRVRKAVRGE